MPKITKKEFGKKMTREEWNYEIFFIPLAFTSIGKLVGEGCAGLGVSYDNDEQWIDAQEPKESHKEGREDSLKRLDNYQELGIHEGQEYIGMKLNQELDQIYAAINEMRNKNG